MKKDKTNTHGFLLTRLLIGFLIFLSILYLKWYFFDREKELDNKELQEMVNYHHIQGRDIIVFE